MTLAPTDEQLAARDMFAAGKELALVAGAGTGKTSTLVLMGDATKRRGLYVAFNRSIAEEAKGRFGPNVTCRTAHSLAYKAAGHSFQARLNASARIPAKETARLLGINRDLWINKHPITQGHQARLVTGMIRRFCYSTDQEVMARHLETVNGLDSLAQDHVARVLLPFAQKAWNDICTPSGTLRFEHDHYLKIWALTEPSLDADFVLLDEAQDTNPVLEEVFLAQNTQRVCVGDPAQQIYAWRNARDVMTGFPAEHLHLTRSFRFGPRIARAANRWLKHAESELQLTGGGGDSRVGPTLEVDAVLCRGNADAMKEVLDFLAAGTPVALAGGGAALRKIAEAAQQLKAGRRTGHPELFLFSSWAEVQEFALHDGAGQDLKSIVTLVDEYGSDLIIDAVDRLADERAAKVTVSTVHKAKGREWARVRIGDGFTEPPTDEYGMQRTLNPGEARLIYVAVTRARDHLDPAGVTWIDEYEKFTFDAVNNGTVGGVRLIDHSLTLQLRYPKSPMSQFMDQHLPNNVNVVRDYLLRIAGLRHPIQPIDVKHPDWPALGHAIDLRLRISLSSDFGTAVTAGIDALSGHISLRGAPSTPVRLALHRAGRELLSMVKRHLAQPTLLDEDTLCRLCFVAGYYEDIYRTGEIRRYSLLASATPATTLEQLIATVPQYAIEDIDQQMKLAVSPFAPFRELPSPARVCGPTFDGSGDIGGADADFILGGLLLDCKAAIQPRRLGREEIYQLAGYLLLDYNNRFNIDRVGLYLSRQGALISWSVPDFLQNLGSAKPVGELRKLLRAHLAHAAKI